MAWLLIILGNSLADFNRRGSDHGIEIGIVIRRTPEDIHAQSAFFERLGVAVKRTLHHKTQKIREAFALSKLRARENPPDLYSSEALRR